MSMSEFLYDCTVATPGRLGIHESHKTLYDYYVHGAGIKTPPPTSLLLIRIFSRPPSNPRSRKSNLSWKRTELTSWNFLWHGTALGCYYTSCISKCEYLLVPVKCQVKSKYRDLDWDRGCHFSPPSHYHMINKYYLLIGGTKNNIIYEIKS